MKHIKTLPLQKISRGVYILPHGANEYKIEKTPSGVWMLSTTRDGYISDYSTKRLAQEEATRMILREQEGKRESK